MDDYLDGRKRGGDSDQRLARLAVWPRALLYDLRGSFYPIVAGLWAGSLTRSPDFRPYPARSSGWMALRRPNNRFSLIRFLLHNIT